MTYSEPARTRTRRIPWFVVAGLLTVVAAIPATLGFGLPASSSSTAASPIVALHGEPGAAPGDADAGVPDGTTSPTAAPPIDVLRPEHRAAPGQGETADPDSTMVRRREHQAALGEADGAVPVGTTVLDDGIPGVANLDSDLLDALRQAAMDAAADGIEFFVDSGWRSPEYQEQLLREAVSEYGSEAEAARWVATPNTSAHVTGDAVDIGHADARAWLSRNGAAYGLCQIYRNEPWHYELRPAAIDHGCAPMYADPTHDPRMQQ